MTTFRSTPPVIAMLCALIVGACGAGDEAETGEIAEAAETAEAAAVPAVQLSMPDTLPSEVWAYLQAEDYTSWSHWPEKGEKYQGGAPHGALLTTYVNGTALAAIENGTPVTVPADGIVVKENYMPDGTLDAVTVMYKVPGYNAEHNDWWFMKRMVDGTVAAAGRVEGCQNCHIGGRANDYLLTPIPGQ